VVLIQENHTTDNYFSGPAGYGASVATGWPVQANPPAHDLPHDRAAYYGWLSGQGTAGPLLMFGGTVRPGIDSRWCSHVSVPKAALQVLGLPPTQTTAPVGAVLAGREHAVAAERRPRPHRHDLDLAGPRVALSGGLY
jgi:hypothetical protein